MNKQRFFYLKQNGRIFGPFPAAHILKLFRSDALQLEDEISVDKVNWKNALQFFNVPDETEFPFELPRKKETVKSESKAPVKSDRTPSEPEVPLQRNYASMQHLYIIFAAFMIIIGIAALIMPVPAETKPSAAKSLFDMSASGGGPKKLSDLAPDASAKTSAFSAPAGETAPESEKTEDAPIAVKKASAAFILTLFSDLN